jgi:hypothetical protein
MCCRKRTAREWFAALVEIHHSCLNDCSVVFQVLRLQLAFGSSAVGSRTSYGADAGFGAVFDFGRGATGL